MLDANKQLRIQRVKHGEYKFTTFNDGYHFSYQLGLKAERNWDGKTFQLIYNNDLFKEVKVGLRW